MTMKFFSTLLRSEHCVTHILLISNIGQTPQNDFLLIIVYHSTSVDWWTRFAFGKTSTVICWR